uniref:Uncharacterized protein n=1 Tax=Oryza punctata TaxID=4537 RepID=A0A0E0LVZ1_ORYPU
MHWTGKRIGRARVGRGRMKWRGKVVLSFGGTFAAMWLRGSQAIDAVTQLCALPCRHCNEHLLCMHVGDCFVARGAIRLWVEKGIEWADV